MQTRRDLLRRELAVGQRFEERSEERAERKRGVKETDVETAFVRQRAERNRPGAPTPQPQKVSEIQSRVRRRGVFLLGRRFPDVNFSRFFSLFSLFLFLIIASRRGSVRLVRLPLDVSFDAIRSAAEVRNAPGSPSSVRPSGTRRFSDVKKRKTRPLSSRRALRFQISVAPLISSDATRETKRKRRRNVAPLRFVFNR